MERATQGDITLDICKPCGGVWFDTGEINAVYDVQPQPSLAQRALASQGHGDSRTGQSEAGEPLPAGLDVLDLLWVVARLLPLPLPF